VLGSSLIVTSGTGTVRTLTLTSGTLDQNGQTITCDAFVSNNGSTSRALKGLGNINISGRGTTAWYIDGNLAVNQRHTVAFTSTSSTGTRSIVPGYWAGTCLFDYIFSDAGDIVNLYGGTYGALNLGNLTGSVIAFSSAMTISGNFQAPPTGMTGSGSLVFSSTGTASTGAGGSVAVPVTFASGTWSGTLYYSSDLTVSGATFNLTRALNCAKLTISGGVVNLNDFDISAETFDGSTGTGQVNLAAGNIRLSSVGGTTISVKVLDLTSVSVSGSGAFVLVQAQGVKDISGEGSPVSYATVLGRTLVTGTKSQATAPNITVQSSSDTVTFSGPAFVNNLNVSDLFSKSVELGLAGSGNFVTTGSLTAASDLTAFGDFIGSTLPLNSTIAGSLNLSSSDAATLSGAGMTLNCPVNINGGGAYTLASSLQLTSTRTLTLTSGSLTCGAYAVSAGSFTSPGTATRALSLGSSAWTLAGSGAVWSVAGSGFTFDKGTATITLTSGSAKTFAGYSLSYPTLVQSGLGALTITGSNTFADLRNTVQPCSVFFASGSNNSFEEFSLSGSPDGQMTISSTPQTAQHMLTKIGGGVVEVGYCTISWSNAVPANTWFAAA